MHPITRRTTLALLLVSPFANAARAQAVFTDGDGLAIRGTDPVAYFTEDKAVEGSAEFEAEYNGSTWRFASAENRDKFIADPEAFAPQYGGFCAYAAAQNSKAPIDPEAWSVVDGKLYLNFSKSIRRRWRKDIPGYIEAADANWPTLRLQ
jgi:YHS domain-containing protein